MPKSDGRFELETCFVMAFQKCSERDIKYPHTHTHTNTHTYTHTHTRTHTHTHTHRSQLPELTEQFMRQVEAAGFKVGVKPDVSENREAKFPNRGYYSRVRSSRQFECIPAN